MNVLVLGRPTVPKIDGREHIITSDDAFFLEKLPKKIIIVGEVFFFWLMRSFFYRLII